MSIYAKTTEDFAEAAKYFEQARRMPSTFPQVQRITEYDLFVSYSRKDTDDVDYFLDCVRQRRSDVRIFHDRQSLQEGWSWQKQIYDSIDISQKVVAFLSPDYVTSSMCQEEFNMAMYRARGTNDNLLFPIFLKTTDLPSYMALTQHSDCREADPVRLEAVVQRLLSGL